jgi:hypothetical protein
MENTENLERVQSSSELPGSSSFLVTESAAAIRVGLPDDLVRLEEEGWGDRDAEGLGGLEVED